MVQPPCHVIQAAQGKQRKACLRMAHPTGLQARPLGQPRCSHTTVRVDELDLTTSTFGVHVNTPCPHLLRPIFGAAVRNTTCQHTHLPPRYQPGWRGHIATVALDTNCKTKALRQQHVGCACGGTYLWPMAEVAGGTRNPCTSSNVASVYSSSSSSGVAIVLQHS